MKLDVMHTQGMCQHQHPAEAEKKAESRMNYNKEVIYITNNILPHHYNNITNHICDPKSHNCTRCKENQESNCTCNNKRIYEYIYHQERHEYDRE